MIVEPGEPIATVGLGERIDPANAPRPSNESERLLFRQIYETLVHVDCNGRVSAGLASSWRFDANGSAWIVTLRENARFSDGARVTAADVRASWTHDVPGDELRPDVSRLVQSIVAVDERTLTITLRTPRSDVPLALAHTDLAIARTSAGSRWPIGTRSSRVAQEDRPTGSSASSVLTLERDGLPSVRFLVAPSDPRDLLDAGVELLVTRDPATLAYAATLSRFQSVPLAWQRTHVLITSGRARTSATISHDARQALARDAVRGEARGALGPFWWETSADCGLAHSPPEISSSLIARIVYESGDAAARDLAERFVGLAHASRPGDLPSLESFIRALPPRTYERAAALSGEALARARRVGRDAGYIVSLDSRPLDSCRELQVLLDGAQWLDPGSIVPLIDTRLRALVRLGRSGVTAEWDGGLVVAATPGSSR